MNAFEIKYGEWVVARRWWIVAATLLAAVAAAGGIPLLTFNNDTRAFFSEENPQLIALEALEDTYTEDNDVLFVLAPREGGDVFTRETLAAIEQLTRASWQLPYSSRVDSLTNFQHTWAEQDELIVEDLVRDAGSLSDAELARIRRIALAEPLLVDRLISSSGRATGVFVVLLLPKESMTEVPEVAAAARLIAEQVRRDHPGIELHLAGGVMMDNAFTEASLRDSTTLIPLMLIILLVLTGLALRSLASTLATLAVIVLSVVTGIGMAGWIGIRLTVASINAPTIILTLAVADSVHILVTLHQQLSLGKSRHHAVAESLRVNLQPVFLTSATTAIGFLTMNFSDAPPFRDLGNIVAMGVIAAFGYSVLFLPAVMALVPRRAGAAARTPAIRWDPLVDFLLRRRRAVFWGMLTIILLLSAGILRIDLDDDFFLYFDESFEIRRATDFAKDHLTGLETIDYSLESGEPGGISNPEYLRVVEAFAQWYRRQEKVTHVFVLTDVLKRLNRNLHGDDDAFYRLPDERDLAAQYLLLYEMSLPFGLDLNDQINVDKSSIHMTVIMNDVTMGDLREMEQRGRRWLATNAPASMYTYGTGLSIIWAHITLRNISSMLRASLIALVLISALLIVALRSLKLGLVSLIPNLVPAFIAFGIWGLVVGWVGLGQSVIVSLTLGIVVDDTVHFLSKYLRARREHALSPARAVRYSFQTVGTAILATTVVLVAGFGVLSLSTYKMNAYMGQMTALTIVLALVLDFLFLPTLLMFTETKTDATTDDDPRLDPGAAAVFSGGTDP